MFEDCNTANAFVDDCPNEVYHQSGEVAVGKDSRVPFLE